MKKNLLALVATAALSAIAAPNPYHNEDLKKIEFTTADHNVRCQGDRAPDPAVSDDEGFKGVECSVYSGNGVPPALPELPAPADCDFDSLTVFTVKGTDSAKRFAACTSDTYYNLSESVPTLPPGETVQGDGWQCTGSKTGLRCENNDKHGFDLSLSRQELF